MYQPGAPPSTGTMTAGTSGATADCGCAPIPAAGYQGVENQLYRVEIHTGGNETTATFKWSRENGSVVAAVTGVSGSTIQVNSLGLDANLGFQAQQWVELSDDSTLFGPTPNQPGALYQIQSIQPADPSLTLAGRATAVDPTLNARARRWDQTGPSASSNGIPLSAGSWIQLENGIQVCFAPGTYNPGDYWTIAARTATGTIEWPPCGSGGDAYQSPHSMLVAQAPLGCIHWVPIRIQPLEETTRTPVALRASTLADPEREALRASTAADTEAATLRSSSLADPLGPIGRRPLGRYTVDDCRLLFDPLTALTLPTAQPVHVETVNWINDDITTLDELIASGLTVQLDQVLSSPVNGANFIVTVESVQEPNRDDNIATSFVPGQGASTMAATVLRGPTIVDSAIAVTTQTLSSGASGSLLSWRLPLQRSSRLQILELEAIDELLATGVATGLYARVRIKLLGEMLFAGTSAGLSHLDGRVLGQPGTRADGSQRVDLKLPSGQGVTSSDLDGWFYLAPPLQIATLATNYSAFTVVPDRLNDVTAVQATVNGVSETVTPEVTITLSYPPIPAAAGTPVTLSLQITQSSAGGTLPNVTSMASVPASVPIVAGESTVPQVPISIFGNPGANTTLTFELGASIALAGGFSAYSTTTFTVTGAPPPLLTFHGGNLPNLG
jgi:hypothetical protein